MKAILVFLVIFMSIGTVHITNNNLEPMKVLLTNTKLVCLAFSASLLLASACTETTPKYVGTWLQHKLLSVSIVKLNADGTGTKQFGYNGKQKKLRWHRKSNGIVIKNFGINQDAAIAKLSGDNNTITLKIGDNTINYIRN